MAEESEEDSGIESEGWLMAFGWELFEEKDGEEKEERYRAAAAFAAKRREMGWRMSHHELYDRTGQGRIDTAAGPLNFERGQGQQGRAWDCSLVLAKYLEKHPEEVRARGVLELGCGVGIPGLAAAVLGAEEVILTDMAEGLPTIERTIELNPAVAGRLEGRVLRWGDEAAAAQLLASRRYPVSVILCSDLLYGDGAPPAAAAAAVDARRGKRAARLETVGGGGTGSSEGRGDRAERGVEGGEDEDEVVIGAAEALAITLSTVVRVSSSRHAPSSECVILSCHERRWAGDQGAFFFETMARKGFCVETILPGDIDERYRGDNGIFFSRIQLRTPV